MNGLDTYIAQFVYVSQDTKIMKTEETGRHLLHLLTINPGPSEANARKQFKTPNDFDLYKVPEKFRKLVVLHIQLMRAIYVNKSFVEAFDTLNEMCLCLVRACEQQDKWIMPAVVGIFSEFVMVYKAKNKRGPEDLDSFMVEDNEFGMESGDSSRKKKKLNLETLIDTLRRGFNVVFNDKNTDINLSKKHYVFFFLGNLMKYCFKMGKLDFAKSIMKTVESSRQNLPNMSQNVATKKYAIMYLYYTALIALDDGDYVTSEARLDEAMSLVNDYNVNTKSSKQVQSLLLILIPLKIYNHGKLPKGTIYNNSNNHNNNLTKTENSTEFDNQNKTQKNKNNKKKSNESTTNIAQNKGKKDESIWQRFPYLAFLYRDNFFPAMKQGSLLKYENVIEANQLVLLRRHIYILMQLLTQFVQVQVIKKTYAICQEIEKSHIISLSAFQLGLTISKYYSDKNQGEFRLDILVDKMPTLEVETILATLISQGRINAYISNGKQCVVFSKTNPFPTFGEKKR